MCKISYGVSSTTAAGEMTFKRVLLQCCPVVESDSLKIPIEKAEKFNTIPLGGE